MKISFKHKRLADKIMVFLSLFGVLALNTGRTITENGYSYVIIIAGAFVLAVLSVIIKENRPHIKVFYQISFLLMCYMSVSWASYPAEAQAAVKSVLLTTAIIFSFAVLIDDEEMIKFFCRAFVVVQILALVFFSFKYGFGFLLQLREEEMINQGGLNANSVGMSLVYSSFIAWTYAKITDKKVQFYYICAAVFAVFAVMTASKKVILLLLILYVGYFLLRSQKPLALIGKLLVSAIVVYLVYYLIMNNKTLYELVGFRFEEVFDWLLRSDLDKYSSTGQRVQMVELGKKLFQKKPWLGWGIANAAKFSVYDTYLHNNYYELLSGIGLVGTVIYYLRFVVVFKTFRHTREKDNFLPILFFLLPLSVLCMDYALVSYNERYIQVIIGVSISYISILKYKKKQAKRLSDKG